MLIPFCYLLPHCLLAQPLTLNATTHIVSAHHHPHRRPHSHPRPCSCCPGHCPGRCPHSGLHCLCCLHCRHCPHPLPHFHACSGPHAHPGPHHHRRPGPVLAFVLAVGHTL